MICHRYKCIFIHQRKCAGTSIIRNFGISPDQPEWRIVNDGYLSREPNTWESVANRYSDYHIFSIIRNPWDRFVSGWKYCESTKNRDIIDVLKNLPKEGHDYKHVTRLQSEILFNDADLPIFHTLLRFETLQTDWEALCMTLGKPPTTLSHLNKTEHLNYREYFNEQALDLFTRHFEADCLRFGYAY